ncbi:hypothetical protein [Corynebacterium sp. NML130628]|uniref:hypothetical protein n=1 Tax=Corynebacterium sp. NML130628 TaxID=1906333 RepID=UPI0008FB3F22|nr:hypothetical protein [Corynebacterium sp. NML130628]
MSIESSRPSITGPVSSAEERTRVPLPHHGRFVIEVVDASELKQRFRDRETLQDATLALVRVATDKGNRTELDEVIEQLGFSRYELAAELSPELHSNKT